MLIRIIIDLLIVGGLVFAVAGTIGILKMPDPFSRMQAATCISTMGVLGVALGGIPSLSCTIPPRPSRSSPSR